MLRVVAFLYSLAVEPIEYILETAFCYFRSFFSGQASIPMAIVAVSLLVNLLTLPIYNAADAKQLEERNLQKKLSRGIAHIKAAFKGDERFLMLSEYYRQNHYSPLYALRSSLSILVQVPFFVAAYHFLSNCPELAGVSLGPIGDLKEPDALLPIGSLRLNLLPILMTAINIVSGAIYTRSAPVREKVQVYGLALVFLVLLYGSPSGLVFYWTLNNLFSLAKNFIQGRRNPRSWIKTLFCLALVAFCLYMAFFKPRAHLYKKFVLYAVTLAVCLLCIFSGRVKAWLARVLMQGRGIAEHDIKLFDRIFVTSCLGLFLLIGSAIPLSVLGSDPDAFSFLEGYSSPFRLFWPTFIKAAGLILLWPLFIYSLSEVKERKIMSVLSGLMFVSALLNFYTFSGDYGILSDLLVYERDDVFSTGVGVKFLNLLVLALVAVLVCVTMQKKLRKILLFIVIVLNIAVAGHALVEAGRTKRGYDIALSIVRRNEANSSVEDMEPIFTLSRTGKNVFCIMLDKATGAYLEECFREDPKLYEQYEGFVFYPNTVSYSYGTLAGFPGLYGGYEYVPAVMNQRKDVSMHDKLEEATSLLPRIFSRNGYSSVMTDIPPATLSTTKVDAYFMDKFPENIKSFVTERVYEKSWRKEHGFGVSNFQLEIDRKRFLSYSVLRACPNFLRTKMYADGSYLISYYELDNVAVAKKLQGVGESIWEASLDGTIGSYSALDYLPQLTKIVDGGDNFVFMQNQLTHRPNVLQVPEYVPVSEVTQTSSSIYAADKYYYVNMAALKLLGEWLNYLKENSAYDNTRIIISADHGSPELINKDYSCLPRGELTCLLLVKDFGSTGKLKIDDSFMTNADVPSIAVNGLISDPVNPATGNDITSFSLKSPVYGEYTDWIKALKNPNSDSFSIDEDSWYFVHDDIFKAENWGKPSSSEVYEETRKALEAQNIGFVGGGK